jgi:hypothetical protein
LLEIERKAIEDTPGNFPAIQASRRAAKRKTNANCIVLKMTVVDKNDGRLNQCEAKTQHTLASTSRKEPRDAQLSSSREVHKQVEGKHSETHKDFVLLALITMRCVQFY